MVSDIGNSLAKTLSGAWRSEPSPVDLSCAELDEALATLLETGTAGLASRRIQRTENLKNSQSAETLKSEARDAAVRSIMQSLDLEEVMALLNGAGIKAMLFKGWLAAQNYASPECRPMGDFDILILPEQKSAVHDLFQKVRREPAATPAPGDETTPALDSRKRMIQGVNTVDLHWDLQKFSLHPPADVLDRARMVKIGQADMTVPCREDHLRLLCLHFLIHGGQRPIWLCDVAAQLEATGAEFDWDACLGDDPVARNWISTVILLAHHLLDARLDGVPRAVTATVLPEWVPEQVIRSWGQPVVYFIHRSKLATILSDPRLWARTLTREIKFLWPNPISATMRMGATFQNRQRWPNQCKLMFSRASSILSGKG